MSECGCECARLRAERDALIEALRKERAELVALWGKMREAYDNSRWCDMRDGKCATPGGCSRCLTAERDALRLRLAEVERERDELTTKCVVYVVRLNETENERDDARRRAKRLAIDWCAPVDGRECSIADVDVALAYEVEP